MENSSDNKNKLHVIKNINEKLLMHFKSENKKFMTVFDRKNSLRSY